jgi:hypothetical protein
VLPRYVDPCSFEASPASVPGDAILTFHPGSTMSVLSASGFLAADQADAYTTALLNLLGAEDPLVVLRETPDHLREAVRRLSPAQLDIPEAPGKWSTRMVIAHLADSELVGSFRFRMVLAHDRPPLQPYDQDLWAGRLSYERADIEEALERFTALRRSNVRLFERCAPSDLARAGLHAERGEESLDRMRRLYAGHDLAHRRQLARIRVAVTGT